MKKGLLKFLTLSLALVLGASVLVGCSKEEDLSGYVAIDVNPSVELIINKDGEVSEVRAVNEDAKILLSDMNLIGVEIETAVYLITKECEETGYLNQTNKDVSITVMGNSEEVAKKLNDLAEKGVKKASDLAVIVADEIKQALDEQVERIKATNPELYEDLTTAKLKVINSIMEYDRNFTVEIGAQMNMSELLDVLEEYFEEYADMLEDDIERKFNEMVDSLSNEIYAQIDNIYNLYNDGYKALAEKVRELELLEDKFELEIEKANGSLDIQFNFNRDFDQDEDEVLTVEMKAELEAVIGENDILTLDDLDDYVDALEEQVKEILENIDLEQAQKELIAQLKQQIETIKVQVKQTFSVQMTAIREELRAKKLQLKISVNLGKN